jgi:hypothetical protein
MPVLRCETNIFRRATFATTTSPLSALVIPSNSPLQQQFRQDSPSTKVVVAHRGGAVRRTAIAAGAAIGFVAAASAVAWAGAPPAPGYCWCYTDPSRTQGFWDVCL